MEVLRVVIPDRTEEVRFYLAAKNTTFGGDDYHGLHRAGQPTYWSDIALATEELNNLRGLHFLGHPVTTIVKVSSAGRVSYGLATIPLHANTSMPFQEDPPDYPDAGSW